MMAESVENKIVYLRRLAFQSEESESFPFIKIAKEIEAIAKLYSDNVDDLFRKLEILIETLSTLRYTNEPVEEERILSPRSARKSTKKSKSNQESFEKIELEMVPTKRLNFKIKTKSIMLRRKHNFLEEKPFTEIGLYENGEKFGQKYNFFMNSQCHREISNKKSVLNLGLTEMETNDDMEIHEDLTQSPHASFENVQINNSGEDFQDSAINFTSNLTENLHEPDTNAGVHFLSIPASDLDLSSSGEPRYIV